MITTTSVISALTILEDGQLQVRRSDRVWVDGKLFGEQYHRHVLGPGDPLLGQDPLVQKVAGLVWTPAVIAAYLANRQKSITR